MFIVLKNIDYSVKWNQFLSLTIHWTSNINNIQIRSGPARIHSLYAGWGYICFLSFHHAPVAVVEPSRWFKEDVDGEGLVTASF